MLTYQRKHQGLGVLGPRYADRKEIEAFDTLIASQRTKNIANVFWTGGYDSTYVLLRLLLDDNRTVQPLYLMGTVDTGISRNLHRTNREKEALARQSVIEAIQRDFPLRAHDLLPVQELDWVPRDVIVSKAIKNLALFPSLHNQYEAMARFAKFYRIQVHIGVIGIEGEAGGAFPTDKWGTYLRRDLQRPEHVLTESQVVVKSKDANHPFSNLIFPTAFSTKKRALTDADTKGYKHILMLTWSCWFPTPEGQACHMCDMCKHRVIPHPGNTDETPTRLQRILHHIRNRR